MYFITVNNNVNIAVDDVNPFSKKTIVLVHGWPLSHDMYEYQKDVLCEEGYRIVSIDLRGFGLSDAPCNGYTYNQLANDLYEVVTTLRLNPFTLVGFSMGGAIVLRYMTLFHGYNVCKLVLIGAAAPSFTKRPGYPYGMTKEQVDALIIQAYEDRPQMVTDFNKSFFATKKTPALEDWFKTLGFNASGIGTIKTAISLRDEDLMSDLSNVTVPTGIFHGKQDKICPYEFALIMHDSIPNSILYPFEYSGHGVFYEELKLFNQCFLEFLRM